MSLFYKLKQLARISQTAHEEFEAAAKRVDKKFRYEKFINNKLLIKF